MTGAYFSFGQLRETALRLALDQPQGLDTDAVIARAEAYFRFLVGDITDDQF